MNSQRYEQMRMVFLAARELPSDQRESYIRRTCADDEELRHEVMELLVNADGASSFLEQPVTPRDADVNVSADVFAGRNGGEAGSGGRGSKTRGEVHRHDAGFLEGYDLQSEVHRGGQGVVYKALQRSTNRYVAIKVLPEGPMASDRQKQRFEREVTLAANLRHPNIVTVYDSGLTEGRYYYVMEYIHGQPLNEYVAAKALRVDEKLRLFSTICSAVSYAHQQNVIHRDLKPGNILVDARGVPHVVDFGLAKTGTFDAGGSGTPITVTSQFMGTLAYASPEQTMGDPSMVGARSDVYSLGVILFEMLTGRLPYPITHDVVATFKTIREREPGRPSKLTSDLDLDLDTIVLRGLAKEPDRRYQTAADLGADIERYLAGEAIAARRDSITYVLRKRSTAMMRRHRIGTPIIVALLVTLFMWWWGGRVFMWWQWPLAAFERLATQTSVAPAVGEPYQDIRMIAMDDETQGQVERMASREGFDDVNAAQWRSVRRLHGRFMERLAAAGIAGLVWDLDFKQTEPYNTDFIRGVKALQAVNVNPVITVSRWAMDTAANELMAPDIYESGIGWGCPILGTPPDSSWSAYLVMQRSESVQMMGLALAALAAARYPDMDPWAHVDVPSNTVQLRYLPMNSNVRRPALFAQSDRFKLSAIATEADGDPENGLQIGDVVGEYVFELPDQSTMDRIKTSYHETFFMDAAMLKQKFSGKMIVMADQRSSTIDWAQAPDGRRVHGAWGHLAAMDALHRGAGLWRHPRGLGYFSLVLMGAIAGALAAHRMKFTFVSIAWRLAAGLVAFVVVGLLVFRVTGYLCSPVIPFASMVLTCISLGVIERLGGRETSEYQKGSLQWSSVRTS